MASSAFPPPPPYYKLYAPGASGEGEEGTAPPPPPPVQGEYVMFGGTYSTVEGQGPQLPSLEEQGVRQLFPKGELVDFKTELRKLNRSLLFKFMELLQVLVERPSEYARRVEQLGLLLRNMHALLNAVRPHQARATLKHLLEVRLKEQRAALEDVREQILSAEAVLQEVRAKQAMQTGGPTSQGAPDPAAS